MLEMKLVDTLPETGEVGVCYLVKHSGDSAYEEHVYVDGRWYDIGATNDFDLTDYFTKLEADAKIIRELNDEVNWLNAELHGAELQVERERKKADSKSGDFLSMGEARRTVAILQQQNKRLKDENAELKKIISGNLELE